MTIPPSPQQSSLIGNTSFLAAFYLFAIFSALFLMISDNSIRGFGKNLIFFLLSLVILSAILGILLTSTAGAIFGLAMAILLVLIFLIFSKTPKVIKKISLGIILLGIFFSLFLLTTRQLPFWKKIPGINEIVQASLSWENSTIPPRLTALSIGANSVNPAKVGPFRMLFGWGQDHFNYLFQKFYEPRYLQFNRVWFDRAHNKIFDVLTTNGLLGLLAYLLIWFFVFKIILREKDSKEGAVLLFFAVSYFCQNLFLFDTVFGYLSFFSFLALVSQKKEEKEPEKETPIFGKAILKIAILLFSLFFLFVFFSTLIPFRQMLSYIPALSMGRMDVVLKNLDKALNPYNFAQPEMRTNLLQVVSTSATKSKKELESAKPILDKLLPAAEESAEKEKWNARYFAPIAGAYEILGEFTLAEKYWKKSLESSPQRQDLLYSLAFNYVRQGKNKEALELAEKIISLDPNITRDKIYYAVITSLVKGKDYFDETTKIILGLFEGPKKPSLSGEDMRIVRNLFNFYLTLFYKEKNKEMFLETLKREKQFEKLYETTFNFLPIGSTRIQQVIDAFQERGWSVIRIEE